MRREPLAVQTAKGLRPRLGAPFGSCQGHSKRSREKRGSAGLGPLLSCRKLSTRQRPRRRPTRPQALTEGHTAGEEACPGETPRRAPSAPRSLWKQASCNVPVARRVLLRQSSSSHSLSSCLSPPLQVLACIWFQFSTSMFRLFLPFPAPSCGLKPRSLVMLSFLTLRPGVLPADSLSLAASGSLGGNAWALPSQKPKFHSYPPCPGVGVGVGWGPHLSQAPARAREDNSGLLGLSAAWPHPALLLHHGQLILQQ